MNNQLIAATTNSGKIIEIQSLLHRLNLKITSLNDLDNPPLIIEDADTFEGNAIKKAVIISDTFKAAVLSDDSGLCVDALNGRPGVFSARYGGAGLNDSDRCQLLLKEMMTVPESQRGASFKCVAAFKVPGKSVVTFNGAVHGTIAMTPSGTNGFGYDPLFIPDGSQKTMAQLELHEKQKISHRAAALKLFVRWLSNNTDSY